MKRIILALILTLGSFAHANDDALCIARADAALAKVAKVLGLGNGVGHLGGSEITRRTKGLEGYTLLTIGGGQLAAENSDGYINGTAANVEMQKTRSGCEVASVAITTGASYSAAQ